MPLKEFSSHNAWHELFSNILSSSIAGFTARLACHPIDTLKSRIQAPTSVSAEFSGIFKAARTTMSEEGFAGFYRGIGAVLVGGIPATSVYLTTYELVKGMLSQSYVFGESPFLAYFCSGMMAEVMSCIIFVPVDVVKERLQVQRAIPNIISISNSHAGDVPRTRYNGSWHAVRTIFREEGVKGVYRGYGATLFSFGPFSAFYFLFYEKLKSLMISSLKLDIDTLPFQWTLACSSVAGSAAAVVTNPLDLLKLRLQISRAGNKDSTSSLVSILKSSLKSDGVRGLFRGSLARVAFHGPNVAVTMTAFEFVKSRIGSTSLQQ